MKANFAAIMLKLLSHEGGFTEDERDPGNRLPDGRPGSTNLGVTQAVWENLLGKKVSHEDMRALTPERVGYLYRARYSVAIKGDELPSGVDYSCFDAAVNSGPKQASKWLQRAVSVADDGSIGPATLAAVAAYNAADVVQRLTFLQGLPAFEVYGKGWSRRVAEVHDVASGMATA
jgi:lysozyme family protein